MIGAYLLALVVVGRCWYGWSEWRLRMLPDFDLYTAGGLGLYPSPLGRLAGVGGPELFAALSIVSAGLVVVAIAYGARRLGGSPFTAALVFSLSPASLYLSYAGIDAIGLALLAFAFAGFAPALLATLAGLTHLSLAPYALAFVPRLTWPARFVLLPLAGCVVVALLLTPYAGVVYGLFDPRFLLYVALGFGIVALIAWPLFLVSRPTRAFWIAASIGALEVGLQAHVQARYLLPAAVLLAFNARTPGLVTRALSALTDAKRSRRGFASA